MAKNKVTKSKEQIIKDAIQNQGKQVFSGSGTKNVLRGVAGAGLATTYGIEGSGDFSKYGYFGPWIIQNSYMQSIASEQIKSGDTYSAEKTIGSKEYQKEISVKDKALTGLIFEKNPSLEKAMNAAGEAQKTLSTEVGKLMGADTTIEDKVKKELGA